MSEYELLITAIGSFISGLAANAVYDLIRYILSGDKPDEHKDNSKNN